MNFKEHWEGAHTTKSTKSVSWFREHVVLSLELIQPAAPRVNATLIDIVGGASTLVDDLIKEGSSTFQSSIFQALH